MKKSLFTPKIKFKFPTFVVILRFFIILTCILFLPFWVFNLTTFDQKYSQNNNWGNKKANYSKEWTTILVLGAQVNSYNDRPSGVLSERLEKTLQVYKNGGIDKILASGGDREPQVMMNFLEKGGVPKEMLFADWGGLRTIDSCWRAKNIFKINKLIVITQEFHLPRATFLCKSVGMEVLPIASDNSYLETKIYGLFREVFACWDSSIDLINQYKPPIGSDGKEPNLGE